MSSTTTLPEIVPTSSVKVKKRKRKKRDPNRPKRAMTPFLFFACEQRKLLKENGKKMTFCPHLDNKMVPDLSKDPFFNPILSHYDLTHVLQCSKCRNGHSMQ